MLTIKLRENMLAPGIARLFTSAGEEFGQLVDIGGGAVLLQVDPGIEENTPNGMFFPELLRPVAQRVLLCELQILRSCKPGIVSDTAVLPIELRQFHGLKDPAEWKESEKKIARENLHRRWRRSGQR